MPTTPSPRLVRFAVFDVDLSSRELRKNGLRIRLQEQPFRVLELLLDRPGELITREELQRRIWPGETFVDFELGLNTAVKRLRHALGDSADTPRFIETLPRRGYRFIFPVAHDSAPSDAAPGTKAIAAGAGQQVERSDPGSVTESARVHRTTTMRIAAGLAFMLLASGATAAYLAHRHAIGSAIEIHSIAVLPLENLSADPEQEYFADGMTDEVITELARLGIVRVISRTSVQRYKHSDKSLREIARELDVDAVVEGTVMRSGDRVRITAQLIRAADDRHLWADRFDRDLRDVLSLQADLARAVAINIERELTPRQSAQVFPSRQVNPDAFDAYLRGRQLIVERRTLDGLNSAIRYFNLAIEKDPNFAPAYAALADCYTDGMFVARPVPPRQAWMQATHTAEQALQLEDSLGQAHIAMATVYFRYDWNWAEAEREFRRAVELNPNDAQAYAGYSVFLGLMGRTEEALAAVQRAQQLDPVSATVSNLAAWSYAWAHRYDDALRRDRMTLELDPTFAAAHDEMARSYEAKGMWKEAVSEWMQAFTSRGMDADTARGYQHAYETGGMKGFWRKWLEVDEENLRHGGRPRLMEVARLSFLIGDTNATFGWLEEAYKERDPGLPNLYFAADWAADLRSDPRYLDLARRIGLPR